MGLTFLAHPCTFFSRLLSANFDFLSFVSFGLSFCCGSGTIRPRPRPLSSESSPDFSFSISESRVLDGGTVRVRWGTPTASVGHYLNPYSVLDLFQDDMGDVKFIRVGGSNSIIDVTYFG